MMRDKSLGIWLTVLFGISGIAVLLLAWLWPTLEPERITATLTGSAGILVALIQVLTLRRSPGRTADKPAVIEVEIKDSP